MAVTVFTDNAHGLLLAVKKAIDDERVRTWSYDSEGDFTHTPTQWANKAWLRPRIQEDRLIFNILTPTGTTLSTELYAIYHGRFIEMLLAHFDSKFNRASAGALPSTQDVVE